MKIAVCLSQVPDTTTPIKIAGDNCSIESQGIQWVINPWDELTLTRAIELREAPDSQVTELVVVHVGGVDAEPVIRKALAMGADRAVRIDAKPDSSASTAKALADYFKSEPYDLILTGLESSDFNGGITGVLLAADLGLDLINNVSSLHITAGKASVKRESNQGTQTINLAGVAVIVTQKGIAIVPRIPSMRGVMSARTKPLQVVGNSSGSLPSGLKGYSYPAKRQACKYVPADEAGKLIDLLRNEARVI
ncbi:MAG: electron transfer flavoprotein beta subunit/FixA family protein [Sphingobacteriia bacterium]|nr:electron transfer flavoprotein beta subunit/FixA family protein [Sphingobacteriia bacterium]